MKRLTGVAKIRIVNMNIRYLKTMISNYLLLLYNSNRCAIVRLSITILSYIMILKFMIHVIDIEENFSVS